MNVETSLQSICFPPLSSFEVCEKVAVDNARQLIMYTWNNLSQGAEHL